MKSLYTKNRGLPQDPLRISKKRGALKGAPTSTPTGILFSYYKLFKRPEKWNPSHSSRWLALIKWFGPTLPAREFCGTEVFLSESERVASLHAYREALLVWKESDPSIKEKRYAKACTSVEAYFGKAVVM